MSQPCPGHQAVASKRWFLVSSSQTSLVVAVQNHSLPSWMAANEKGLTCGWPSTEVARYHAGTDVR